MLEDCVSNSFFFSIDDPATFKTKVIEKYGEILYITRLIDLIEFSKDKPEIEEIIIPHFLVYLEKGLLTYTVKVVRIFFF